MRVIKPNFEIWEQEEGLEGIYKQIERCGRVCYASDPIEGKAKDFVDRMIKLGHGAMLEHGTVYLAFEGPWDVTTYSDVQKYIENPYSKVVGPVYSKGEYREGERQYSTAYITTNLRVLVENGWLEDLQTEVKYNKCYLCEPTEHHEKRVTVHFTTQIAITREFNRHRVNSMAEQSTRYCDYSGQGKKFEEVGINLPSWLYHEEVNTVMSEFDLADYCDMISKDHHEYSFIDIDYWLFANLACEFSYQNLRKLGWTPQQARTILPLDTNTQLSHTAFVSDWKHFFTLRDDEQHAHPDAFALASPLHQEFRCRGYIV